MVVCVAVIILKKCDKYALIACSIYFAAMHQSNDSENSFSSYSKIRDSVIDASDELINDLFQFITHDRATAEEAEAVVAVENMPIEANSSNASTNIDKIKKYILSFTGYNNPLTTTQTDAIITKYTKRQLVSFCKLLHIFETGTKEEIVGRINNFLTRPILEFRKRNISKIENKPSPSSSSSSSRASTSASSSTAVINDLVTNINDNKPNKIPKLSTFLLPSSPIKRLNKEEEKSQAFSICHSPVLCPYRVAANNEQQQQLNRSINGTCSSRQEMNESSYTSHDDYSLHRRSLPMLPSLSIPVAAPANTIASPMQLTKIKLDRDIKQLDVSPESSDLYRSIFTSPVSRPSFSSNTIDVDNILSSVSFDDLEVDIDVIEMCNSIPEVRNSNNTSSNNKNK